MKLLSNILILLMALITNYQLLITNDFEVTDNRQRITDNQFTIHNSQFIIKDNANSKLSSLNSQLFAQVDSTEIDETIADTVQLKPLDDFVAEVPISKKSFEMAKSPTKAVLFSLLLPGLGQYYVESYWKIPVFVGGTGVLTYLIIDNHNNFIAEQEKWEKMDDNDPNKSRSKVIKEFYRDQRDQDIFYLSGVYILAAIDAYVGAHLFDFNVSDDLTLKLQTGYMNGARVGFSLSW
ncbi:MAG: DUF5683 domain-containing protein [bacterium]